MGVDHEKLVYCAAGISGQRQVREGHDHLAGLEDGAVSFGEALEVQHRTIHLTRGRRARGKVLGGIVTIEQNVNTRTRSEAHQRETRTRQKKLSGRHRDSQQRHRQLSVPRIRVGGTRGRGGAGWAGIHRGYEGKGERQLPTDEARS